MSDFGIDSGGFDRLLRRSMDGVATPEERIALNSALRDKPELMDEYIDMLELTASVSLLGGAGEGRFANRPYIGRDSGVASGSVRAELASLWIGGVVERRERKSGRWLRLVASMVAMLGLGVMLKFAADYRVRVEADAAGSIAAVNYGKPVIELLSYSGRGSPEIPQQLPGHISLHDGEAKVRLTSGVELTLVAPVSLELADSMRVRLSSGLLLAFVPQWARGFTVETSQLEIWDLGTVFGVASRGRQDDVFVFEGSVQINESDGNAVDLCVAGEGVRIQRGELPRKIAADWGDARESFAGVAGRQALVEPKRAFEVVDELQAMWVARYSPKPVAKKQVVKAKPKPKPVERVSGGQVAQTKVKIDKAAVALSEKKQEEEMRAVTNLVAATVAAAALGVANVGLAVPTVSNVRLSQFEGSRNVSIKYDLAGSGIITLEIMTNGVSIGDQHVTRFIPSQSGVKPPVNRVVEADDDLEIIWNAGFDWPEMEVEVQAKVTAWSEDAPPLYCAIDLTVGTSAGAGEYPVYYYLSEAGVPGGVSNHIYKTVMILMRQIDATSGSGFMMGSPENETGRDTTREKQVNVKLSKPFYMGVYQITQQQWQQVSGNVRSWPSWGNNKDYSLTRPVERVSWEDIRGTAGSGYNWPDDGYKVNPDSFMGRLRTRTGVDTFDLPTAAQWEWACRADTYGALNNGTNNLSSEWSCIYLDKLGRYQRNGGKILNESGGYDDPPQDCTTDNGTAAVGSYLSNAWGLYDMHGNVYEWCLDWKCNDPNYYRKGDMDPEGATSGTSRIACGGNWADTASGCRSASYYNFDPSSQYSSIGFRLIRNLP